MSVTKVKANTIESCINSGKLQRLFSREWPELRDLYKRDWPKNIVSYYTLKTYIEWLEKNPEIKDVHIYTTDKNWRLHGTYIVEDFKKVRHNVLFDTLAVENESHIMNALKSLRTKSAYTLYGYSENVKLFAEKYLCDIGLTDLSVAYYCPTLLYHLPMEESLKIELGNLMQGYFVGPLNISNISQIDDLWPHQYPYSDYFTERLIRYNLTLGIFNENNGDLCAWIFESEMGTIAMLQVDDKYQRRGFGKYLVALMAKKLAEEKQMDAIATIMETNKPSRRLFENLGFKVINHIYWFDKPAITDD